MKRLVIAVIVVLALMPSAAAYSTSKRVAFPPPKTRPTTTTAPTTTVKPTTTTRLPALGAPTNLRFTLTYSDYRAGTVNLTWRDNSSAETEFVLTEATPGADCRTWSDHDATSFPADTTTASWTVPVGSGRGIGALRAHSAILSSTCPQDYTLIARNGTGDSAPSNVIVLDADTPNTPTDVRYQQLADKTIELRWQYTPKGYPMDISGVTCFYANNVPFCQGPCAWCWAGTYTHQTDYVTVIDGAWFGGTPPRCITLSTQVGTDGTPWAQYATPSETTPPTCMRWPTP